MPDDFDIALFMSAYVEFHTEDPGDGSYIPMTVEEAQGNFLGFIDNLRAEAWDEGFTLATRNNPNHPHPMAKMNPYRTDYQ